VSDKPRIWIRKPKRLLSEFDFDRKEFWVIKDLWVVFLKDTSSTCFLETPSVIEVSAIKILCATSVNDE
jgi:hypothetical protein